MGTAMNIFITGGSGFIGKNLKNYLSSSYNVYTASHAELELLDQEAVKKYIQKNHIDIIIHTAIIGGKKQDAGLINITALNLQTFFNIVRHVHSVQKIIYLGSGLEYDKSYPIVNVTEQEFDHRIPTDDYGLYKYIAAKYIELSDNIYDLVIFGIFGKYEDYLYKFISNAIVKNLFKMPIVIFQNAYFDFLFVDDLCHIIKFFIENKPQYRRYNTVTGKRIDLISMAAIINSVSNYQSEIKVLKKGLNKEYSACNTRLVAEMKDVNFTDHKIAIQNLYHWYKRHIHTINQKEVRRDPFLKFIKTQGTLYKPQ